MDTEKNWYERFGVLGAEPRLRLRKIIRHMQEAGSCVALTDQTLINIVRCGFRDDNVELAIVAVSTLIDERPITQRGLMYRVVSAGFLPDTTDKSYNKLAGVTKTLRRYGLVPYEWIVDGVRETLKPHMWSSPAEFMEDVGQSYRLDHWTSMSTLVWVIVEKDAVAGLLSPLTMRYGVPLSPIRGYTSISFAHEIGTAWKQAGMPVVCYYLGDFDPSGLNLEDTTREEIMFHAGDSDVTWTRLGVHDEDFAKFGLLELPLKTTDPRAKEFKERTGGTRCAEVDALPPAEMRSRVRAAIEANIDPKRWAEFEELEREQRTELQRLTVNCAKRLAAKFGN